LTKIEGVADFIKESEGNEELIQEGLSEHLRKIIPNKMNLIRTAVIQLLFALTTIVNSASLPARAVSFGPMWHWNFGGGDVKFSWAFEIAYWQTYGNPRIKQIHLHGIDAGIEFQGDIRRIYGEYQNGYILFGGSFGPVIELNDTRPKYGIQGGAWGAMFAGTDLRIRKLGESRLVVALGTFAKIPGDLNNGDYGMRGN
jgi:hypothetical protein